MSAKRHFVFLSLSGLALAAGAAMIPASQGSATDTPGPVPLLDYDLKAPLAVDDLVIATQAQDAEDNAALASDSDDTADTAPLDYAKLDSETECMAKVVHHEAGNQSRRGQLAVAQLIVNRMESGRFPVTACGVANQRGQFFPTASYNPRRDTAQWHSAVDVSREAMAGKAENVVPGAMFYHAAYQAPTRWFRTRTRVATLEDHIFYR